MIARNFSSKLFRNILLFTALILPVSAYSDDLDATLALPPSASITQEDAMRRVEALRSLILNHPDRADEIEAYLIPFVRAMKSPLKESPSPPLIRPVPKPMVLIKSPDGRWSFIRALSRRNQGKVIMLVDEKGTRAVLQVSMVAGELPWYSDAELESGGVNLSDLAGRYETFAKVFSGARNVLKPEINRLREMQSMREHLLAERQKAAQDQLSRVTSAIYDPTAGYQAATLAKMLLNAEKVRNELPQFATPIDLWAAPFREHFTKLLSGYSYVDHAWVSNAELARREREKRQREFLNSLDYQIGSVAGPTNIVEQIVAPILIKASVVIVIGMLLLIFGRRYPYLLPVGTVLIGIAPLTVAILFFLATRTPDLLVERVDSHTEQPLIDLLSQSVGFDQGHINTPHKITEDALNSFIARHVRIASEGSKGTPIRRSIMIQFLTGRIAIFEMVQFWDLDWILRLDLNCQKKDEQVSLTLVGARIGEVSCPMAVAEAWWKNLQPQLTAILESSRITKNFTFELPRMNAIELKPILTTTSD